MRIGRQAILRLHSSSLCLLSPILACLCATLIAPSHAARGNGDSNAFSLFSDASHFRTCIPTAQLYNHSGCAGSNLSPQLAWRNAPAGTHSFAITIFDPDAPGPGWWHWAVTNVPADTSNLPANASASGYLRKIGALEARNDFGAIGYSGPCPSPGKPHRYILTIYALRSIDLHLATGRPAAIFDHEISTTAIDSAQIVINDRQQIGHQDTIEPTRFLQSCRYKRIKPLR